jgi:hypothetical protein
MGDRVSLETFSPWIKLGIERQIVKGQVLGEAKLLLAA